MTTKQRLEVTQQIARRTVEFSVLDMTIS